MKNLKLFLGLMITGISLRASEGVPDPMCEYEVTTEETVEQAVKKVTVKNKVTNEWIRKIVTFKKPFVKTLVAGKVHVSIESSSEPYNIQLLGNLICMEEQILQNKVINMIDGLAKNRPPTNAIILSHGYPDYVPFSIKDESDQKKKSEQGTKK